MGDILQRFIFEESAIRGEIVHLSESYTTIMSQHHYPLPIQNLLGQLILASVLLAATIKFKGQLTIQFQGEGPVKMLVAKCDNEFHIRAYASFENDLLSKDEDVRLDGQLVITIQADDNPKPYQSIIDIKNKTIVECIEDYFARSEQLPTKIYLAATPHMAAGLLLQLLPTKSTKNREHFWTQVAELDATLDFDGLTNYDSVTFLQGTFPHQDIRIYNPEIVAFRCTCNLARMENAVYMLGRDEAFDILKTNTQVAVTCEFCNHSYFFDKVDVEEIFQRHHK